MTRRYALVLVLALTTTSCSTSGDGADVDARRADTQPTMVTTTSPPPTPPAMTPAPPGFEPSVAAIDPSIAARMTASWRPGCPVEREALRLLTLDHWDFDGGVRRGELVVHRDHADAIVAVFRQLFDARFPIAQMRLIDEFGGDDDRSMAANNTSAFNCRFATGSQRWSEHAYGRAVDINPVQNPFVTRSGAVLPPDGKAHVRRDSATPGLITSDGPVVAAFRSVGWMWGGDWSPGKDYQHFSATGR